MSRQAVPKHYISEQKNKVDYTNTTDQFNPSRKLAWRIIRIFTATDVEVIREIFTAVKNSVNLRSGNEIKIKSYPLFLHR